MFKQNQEREFVKLIKTQQAIIHSLCKAYFNDNEDRKDTFQDVVLQLWKAYPGFRGEAKISTWIYRVALNTILNKLKIKYLETTYEDLANEIDSATDTPWAIHLENQDLLQFLFNQLNPDDKALLILYLEGYNYTEIADILSITSTNVSTRINRIKSKLKKIFKPQANEY